MDINDKTIDIGKNGSCRISDTNNHKMYDLVEQAGMLSGNGYDYVATLLQLNGKEYIVDEIQQTRTNSNNNWRLRLHDATVEDDDRDYLEYQSRDISNLKFYLVYYKEIEGGTFHQDNDLSRTKTMTQRDDGTYDLELTISGARGTITNKTKVDVLFVLDQSGSMGYSMGSTTRMQAVRNSISALTTSMSGNSNLDVHYALASFSSSLLSRDYYKDAVTRSFWTSSPSTITSAANIYANGGTNYEAGLMEGQALLAESRDDALKFVIFLSDGVPTYYYRSSGDNKGQTAGNGGSYDSIAQSHAVSEARKLDFLNGFIAVRVGSESDADTYLNQLVNAAKNAAFTLSGGSAIKWNTTHTGNETDGFTFTGKAACIKAGKTVTLTESNVDVTGYDCTADNSNASKPAADNAVCSITNTYTVKTGTLVITKEVTGDILMNGYVKQKHALEDNLSFTIKDADKKDVAIPQDAEIVWTETADKLTGTLTLTLPIGTYTVTETGETQPDFAMTTIGNPASVTVSAGQETTCTITNAYQLGSITINKTVSGENKKGGSFTFELTNARTGVVYYATIENAGSITVNNLPMGSYTIKELSSRTFKTDSGKTAVLDPQNLSGTVSFSNTAKPDDYSDNGSLVNKGSISQGEDEIFYFSKFEKTGNG